MSEAVVTSIIGIAGVLLGLLSGHFGEWLQSKRHRSEQKRERELTLKRELYVPLVAAFTECNALLASIPSAPHDSLGTFKLSPTGQNALAAKDLIANKAVILLAGAVSKQFALGLMRLMLLKIEEGKLAIDLDLISKRINQLNTENSEINRHCEGLIAQGKGHEQDFSMFNRRFQDNQTRLEHAFKENVEKQSARNALLKRLTAESIHEMIAFVELSSKAVIAIRDDLELPDESEAIRTFYRDSVSELRKIFPSYLDKAWGMADTPTLPSRIP